MCPLLSLVCIWYHDGLLSLAKESNFVELTTASDVTFRWPLDITVVCALGAPSDAMDLYKAIQDLYAEKEKLERVIASLEELQRTAGSLPNVPKPVKRRGRKSMNPAERQEVSERMRKYWAGRRQPKESSEAVE